MFNVVELPGRHDFYVRLSLLADTEQQLSLGASSRH